MNYILNFPVYIFFGTLPSLIWLNFYLRKDSHPEPKPMVLKIFFFGMLATLPAIFFEMTIFEGLTRLNFSPFLISIFNIFLGVALIEEFLKFLVVKGKVLENPEFDEPVDAMIYMIIAALGFAAGENILILFPIKTAFWGQILSQILGVSVLRFLGATFLHALSSGILGFFIGLSFFGRHPPTTRGAQRSWEGGGRVGVPLAKGERAPKREKLIYLGLILAIGLHGLYNFSIMGMKGGLRILIPFFLLLSSAIFVSFGFKKLKKMVK